MGHVILGAFCTGLLLCIIFDISIIYALIAGLLLFMLYGRRRGFSWRELMSMALRGVRTVRNILITFFLIGIMTALWRVAGTVPFIVCHATKLIRPSVFLLMAFLLNSGLSFLTGTSFGTAATMGMICAAMGAAMNVDPILTGGAVLSGAFFGDRCSPVSTSALLVAAVTETDIYGNIRRMLRSALVPFAATCLIYFGLGALLPHEGAAMELEALFSRSFRLDPVTILPAAAVLLLALLRVDVKLAMGASILTAIPICLFVQHSSFADILRASVYGFSPKDAEVAALINGGGIASMLKVACIVCISSAYSDIFNKTGLLDGAKHAISAFSRKTNRFAAILLSAIVSGMIACNQTLTILLSDQLCRDLYTDRGRLALDLEDTAVVIAPLIPWSIAGAVPLATVGAPAAAVLASFYLILIPVYRLIAATMGKAGNGGEDAR